MADVYKRLGAVVAAATTNTELYVVPGAGVSAVLSSINVCNRNNTTINFRIAHIDGGIGSLANEDYIYYNVPAEAYDTIEITRGITMATGDTLMVYSDTANVNFMVWGSEVS
jgi:hypothetical protein